MNLFGLSVTRTPSSPTTLFGGQPIPISKATPSDIPAGAAFDQAGTDRLNAIAQAVGSTAPAYGVRPSAGALPDSTKESPVDPFAFDFQWGANVAYTPRVGYGAPFAILRAVASTSPIVGLCVQCRKDQMSALDWIVITRDKKATGQEARVAEAQKFLSKPDGVTPLKTWLQQAVDEMLVIDAMAVYVWPNKKGAAALQTAKGHKQRYQLKPDEIYGFKIVDGSTFKVLLDGTGSIPAPPEVAYRQIIKGTPVAGGDCTADDLLYRPKTTRTWTPYGMSPIEMAMLIITADLNRLTFNAAYYTEGNIPEALVGVPDNWGAKQLNNWNEFWTQFYRGDAAARSRLKFVLSTMAKTVHEFKKPDFSTNYDLQLLKVQCACFGLTPSEIGFTDDVNKATSKTQGDVNQRRGVKPTAGHLKGVLDEMLALKGYQDLEVSWSGGEGDDALTQARIVDLGLRSGRLSLDEVRTKDGNPTIGAGPAVYTPTGPVFIEDVIAASEAAGVLDTGGDDDPDEPLPPPAAGADPNAQGGDEAKQAAVLSELKKYATVAIKAVRRGKPVPAFSTRILVPAFHAELIKALAPAADIEAVKAVFAAARDRVLKAQRLSPAQRKAERRLNTKVAGIFAGMKKDLAAHLAAGVK